MPAIIGDCKPRHSSYPAFVVRQENINSLFGSIFPVVSLNLNASCRQWENIKINQEMNMQKSDTIEKNNITWPKFSFVKEHTCPRCRNRDTRLSKRPKGSLFNRVFRKAHRCNTCYSRFWIFRPFRILILTGVMLYIYNYLSPLI